MWMLVLLLACAPKVTVEEVAVEESFEPVWGEVVEGEGFYSVEPVSAGRKGQPAVLFVGREGWIVSYAPDPTRYALVDRRVIFRGRTYRPSPYVASIQAIHVELEWMRLAPGEAPNETDRLPAPPHARTTAEVGARKGRWVQAVGTLVSLAEGDVGATGVLRLDEDMAIAFLPGPASRWEALVGQTVTIIAGVGGHGLEGAHVCAGEADRCGMD